jgi:hypothetical protein
VRTSLFLPSSANICSPLYERRNVLDPIAVERAESEIDGLISRRARENAEANRIEAL